MDLPYEQMYAGVTVSQSLQDLRAGLLLILQETSYARDAAELAEMTALRDVVAPGALFFTSQQRTDQHSMGAREIRDMLSQWRLTRLDDLRDPLLWGLCNWVNGSRVVIRRTTIRNPITGQPRTFNGLFARVAFDCGDEIAAYGGRFLETSATRLTEQELDYSMNLNTVEPNTEYIVNPSQLTVDGLRYFTLSQVGRWANSFQKAQDNNAVFIVEPDAGGPYPGIRITVRALRPISVNDEIFVVYGEQYHGWHKMAPVVDPVTVLSRMPTTRGELTDAQRKDLDGIRIIYPGIDAAAARTLFDLFAGPVFEGNTLQLVADRDYAGREKITEYVYREDANEPIYLQQKGVFLREPEHELLPSGTETRVEFNRRMNAIANVAISGNSVNTTRPIVVGERLYIYNGTDESRTWTGPFYFNMEQDDMRTADWTRYFRYQVNIFGKDCTHDGPPKSRARESVAWTKYGAQLLADGNDVLPQLENMAI